MEKEHQPDSMATITMKPEYPPSEVYSASEPPPAYRQRMSSSVQIARIAAITVIASSFILGSFILASSWVAARSSCHQLEQLDAMLDKELALEGRPYGNDALMPEPLPVANAHALHGQPPLAEETTAAPVQPKLSPDSLLKEDPLNHEESKIDEDKLQKIDDDKADTANSSSDESSESENSSEDEDDDFIRPLIKMPTNLDLTELLRASFPSNQKDRMNCVVEHRNENPIERRFPFNILGALAPQAKGERISIICHEHDDRAMPVFPDPQSQVFAFPLTGPVRLPLRPAPEQREPRGPFQMPQRPFLPQMPWDSSEDSMNPREMRIHVQRVFAIPTHNMPPQDTMGPFPPPPPPQSQEQHQREEQGPMEAPRQMRVIAIPAPQNMNNDNMGPFQPPPLPQEQNEQQGVLHQFVPQPAPTQELEQPEMKLPWEIFPEELHRSVQEAVANQQRQQMDNDNDMQEVKTIVNTLAAAEMEAEQREQAQSAQDGQRAPRTLLLPQEMADQRPHYMQPRSVRAARSVNSPLLREKRVKRCSCDCI
ncbi:unnamed protein product [Danaus chrysippus]|uniref:(African queen) hypothetical protein n=1 Tax=Danaus chrysippus TaxID=151541 RepID=A0A8J2QF31_9NEOP|nr:unnamed protein product [Danaus chrysippus]